MKILVPIVGNDPLTVSQGDLEMMSHAPDIRIPVPRKGWKTFFRTRDEIADDAPPFPEIRIFTNECVIEGDVFYVERNLGSDCAQV